MDRLDDIQRRMKAGEGIYAAEWEDPDWSDLEWLLAEVERLRARMARIEEVGERLAGTADSEGFDEMVSDWRAALTESAPAKG